MATAAARATVPPTAQTRETPGGEQQGQTLPSQSEHGPQTATEQFPITGLPATALAGPPPDISQLKPERALV